MKKKLAVVIPCWNEEKLLPEMLDCLLKQNYKDWVALCVDDQSTDKTAEIIQSYQAKDNRIQYFCRDREPKGGQTCRNIGIEKAKGAKYIAFFDADDLIAPYCFEQRIAFMEAHSDLDCGVFPIIAYSHDIHETTGPVFGVKAFDDDLQAMIGFTVPFNTATNIYKYQSLLQSGMQWDEHVKSYQDVEFHTRFMLSDMSYAFANEARADYFYHFTNDGVANQIKSAKHVDSHLYLLNKMTQMVNAKYGDKYDFYLEATIVRFLGLFAKAWKPYFEILKFPWMQERLGLKLRILLYLLILKKDRRLVFYKYRKYSKKQNAIWAESLAEYRKKLLERGVEV